MNEINHELGIIALESCRELGQQVNKIIQQKHVKVVQHPS